jgi:hypothetical protein
MAFVGRVRRLERYEKVLLALGAANVGWLVVNAGTLVSRLYLSPDVASAPVIGSLIGGAPAGRVVTLGNYPWYESLWFMELTRWLPAHREIWEAGPFVLSAVVIGVLVWMAQRAVGGRAALITAVTLCCTTNGTRVVLFTLTKHGAALLHGVLLGASLVFLNRSSARLSTFALVFGGFVLGSITALGLTDHLLIVEGLIPFVSTACFGWWRTRRTAQRKIALFAIGVTIWAIVEGELIQRAMHLAHVVPTGTFNNSFLSDTQLLSNVSILFSAFSDLGGGTFFGAPIGGSALLALVAGALTLTAGGVVLRWCWRAAPRLLAQRATPSSGAAMRETYLVYWAATLACTVGAFVLFGATIDSGDSRYIVAAFVGVAALLPVLTPTTRQAQYVLVAGVSAYALLALRANITEGPYAYGTSITTAETQQLVSFANQQDLVYGYADYNTAPVLTWATGLRLQVFPVMPCGQQLCPFLLHTISSWYTPRPDTRTFLIIDQASQGSYGAVPGTEAAFGNPINTAQFGALTIYVYDHDIAAQF